MVNPPRIRNGTAGTIILYGSYDVQLPVASGQLTAYNFKLIISIVATRRLWFVSLYIGISRSGRVRRNLNTE